jgi:hypothetical protein
LSRVEIDAPHIEGDPPKSCQLYAIKEESCYPGHVPVRHKGTPEESYWATILPLTELEPNKDHSFPLQNVDGIRYTHVMLTIYPGGGVKRVRVMGTRKFRRPSDAEALAVGEGKTDDTHGESRPYGGTVRLVGLYHHVIDQTGEAPESDHPTGMLIGYRWRIAKSWIGMRWKLVVMWIRDRVEVRRPDDPLV